MKVRSLDLNFIMQMIYYFEGIRHKIILFGESL